MCRLCDSGKGQGLSTTLTVVIILFVIVNSVHRDVRQSVTCLCRYVYVVIVTHVLLHEIFKCHMPFTVLRCIGICTVSFKFIITSCYKLDLY